MKKIIPFIIFLLILGLAGATFYFYREYRKLQKDPQTATEEEEQRIIDRVSEIMVLPEGERPTVVTVLDVDRLRDQQFFANAENGFKVLIFSQAKKAILYDPINHKIVEAAPVTIGADATGGTSLSPESGSFAPQAEESSTPTTDSEQ